MPRGGLLKLLHRWRNEAGQAGRQIKRIVVAYEAGRDGFWLARWLRARDVEAYVIHPTSIAVSREHRRAKTDRLDTELLMRAFLGWLRGEKRHCSMVAIPTIEEEDARRPNRERQNLVTEQTRIVNQIKASSPASAFAPSGQPCAKPRKSSKACVQRKGHLCWKTPARNCAATWRDYASCANRSARSSRAAWASSQRPGEKGPHAMVRLIARVLGVGIETADMLVNEVLSRRWRDHKAVPRYAGLTGSPDESGRRRRERGLARAGKHPRPVRHDPIRLAFSQIPKGQCPGPMVCRANRR